MKTIIKEETKIIKTELYVSEDGKEFTNKEDCNKWEKSYGCILQTSWDKLIKDSVDATNFGIPWSTPDDEAYVIIPKNLEDITLINAYLSYVTRQEVYQSLDISMIDKLLLINFGYDREYCEIHVMDDFLSSLTKLWRNQEEKLRNLSQNKGDDIK